MALKLRQFSEQRLSLAVTSGSPHAGTGRGGFGSSFQIEVELHELDGTVGRELGDDDETSDHHPGRDEGPVVGTARDQLGEVVEPGRKPIDDLEEFEHLEVVCRRLAVGPSLGWQLPIKVLEESGGRTNDPPRFGHPSRMSASAMRSWTRLRTLSRSAGGMPSRLKTRLDSKMA